MNARLKEDPQAFAEEVIDSEHFTYNLGSPLEKLIPRIKMAANFFKKSKMAHKPENVYLVLKMAGVFAYNFGALNFGQGQEIAAAHALMAVHNVAVCLGTEIARQKLSVKDARLMTVTFGETANRHLKALEPKKIKAGKPR